MFISYFDFLNLLILRSAHFQEFLGFSYYFLQCKDTPGFLYHAGNKGPYIYRENVCIFTNSRLQIFSKILDVVEEQFNNIFYVVYVLYC